MTRGASSAPSAESCGEMSPVASLSGTEAWVVTAACCDRHDATSTTRMNVAERMADNILRLMSVSAPPSRVKRHHWIVRLTHWLTFALLVGMIMSGLQIYGAYAQFGGFQGARYWHFWAVWIFTAFLIVHVVLVFVVDPASLRAMITGWYRGRFPSHD